jgi:hypothetical protein
MSQVFGMESPRQHPHVAHRQPVRYLVVIESGGLMIARLLLDTRVMVGEMDAAVEEVSSMISGQTPQMGALGSEWDTALAGHSIDERAAAKVFTLAV